MKIRILGEIIKTISSASNFKFANLLQSKDPQVLPCHESSVSCEENKTNHYRTKENTDGLYGNCRWAAAEIDQGYIQ